MSRAFFLKIFTKTKVVVIKKALSCELECFSLLCDILSLCES